MDDLIELEKKLGHYKNNYRIYISILIANILVMYFSIMGSLFVFLGFIVLLFLLFLYNYIKFKNIKKEILNNNDSVNISCENNILEEDQHYEKDANEKIENEVINELIIDNIDTTEIEFDNKKLHKSEEEVYISSFDNIPKYDLSKELDDKYFKSLLRTNEVDYDKFIKYPNTTKKPYNFVVLDFETTGLSPIHDEIIQIGAIKFEYYKPIEIFSTYIKPNKNIPKKITQITDITNEDVKNSPNIEEVLPKLLDFIGDNYIVAHNAPFDISFLLNNLYKCNFKRPKNKAIDTLKLARSKLREYDCDKDKNVKLKTYKLEELKKRFNLWDLNSHDALSDCKVCAYVYINIVKQWDNIYCLY